MRIIPLDHYVLGCEVVNTLHPPRPPELGEWAGLALELRTEGVDVVAIDVGVTELDDQFVCLGISDVGDHVHEEMDVELAHHVEGRESHIGDVCRQGVVVRGAVHETKR